MPVTTANIVSGGTGTKVTVAGVDIGAVKEGVTTTLTFEIFTVDLEQETIPTKAFKSAEKLTCEFTMCEPTLENVKIGWSGASAIGAGPPRTLSIVNQQFVNTEVILVVTGTSAGGGLSGVRTITFGRAVLETPAPLVISKRQETNLKVGFLCLADATNKAASFSDAA